MDPRKRRERRHPLAGLLAVGIAAVIAGSKSFAAVGVPASRVRAIILRASAGLVANRVAPGMPAARQRTRSSAQARGRQAHDRSGHEDLSARVISAFLDDLEAERHNTPRTRNARRGAIRSLFRYAELRHPEHAELIAQVLAIPQKRFAKATMSFLTPAELEALLAPPDLTTWEGRREGT